MRRLAAFRAVTAPWWFGVVLAGLSSAPLSAQSPATRQAIRLARTAAAVRAPVIDGRLDEAVWHEAEPLGDFVQREPAEGAAATERTEVRILTDGQALYIGAWLFDRDPRGIVAGERLRDVEITNSDYFAFILDTYHDRQNGFLFATTPAGIEYDGQVTKEGEGGGVSQQGQSRVQSGAMGGFNLNWDASWTVATSVDSLGWYAEFRIPFSTLRYGGGKVQRWGFNAGRNVRRKNEESFWSSIPRQYNLYRLSQAGTLEGLAVPSKRVATVTPYALGSAKRDFLNATEADYPVELGADAKVGLTPSLTLDLTYNTDFAQVEVDEQRTNLTRFPLFFPEKRPFFLENAGVFSAGTPQQVDLFFTRRIGIDSVGQPVPIVGGGRLTGKVGGVTIGALQIFTESRRVASLVDQPGNSYSVGRVSREFGARSRIGALFVQRLSTDSGGDHNRVYALDGRVGLSDRVTIDWWGARSDTPGRDGRDAAFSAAARYLTSEWDNNVRFTQVGEDFNAEVGFVPRTGYRYYEGGLFRTVPVTSRIVRYWMPHVSYRGYYGFDGRMQTDQLHIDLGETQLNNGGRLGPELNRYGEGLTAPFEIAPGVVIPAGTYRYWSLGWDFVTNPSAPLSLTTRLDIGGLYDGRRIGGSTTLTYRRGAALTTSLLVDYNDVHLDEGDFVRSLIGVRLGYHFTPRISVQSLVQYSNQADVFSANVRFAWLNTAGTGLFVVFNEAQEAEGFFRWTRPQVRSFVVKFTRQFGTGR